MCGITLLQFYDDVSDEEAVDRLLFDLRWKVALNLPLDFEPPHPTTIGVFRRRLVQHGLREARYIGIVDNRLQAHWTGAGINLRRLFTLFEGNMARMRRVLAMRT